MIHQMLDKIHRIELPIPFPLKTMNVYFVNDSPRTLVDAGIKTEASLEALKKGLEAIGHDLNSIERILITHGHIDHYGQAKKLSSLSGAPIYIHSKEYGRIRSAIHSLGILKSMMLRNGVPQDLVNETIRFMESAQGMGEPLEEAFFLDEGDPIPFKSMNWKTIHCPGHAPGLICFHWPEKKILFTGDHILKEITPNPVINVQGNKPPFRYPSLKEYLNSLEKIAELDLSLLLPAHGEEVHDARGLIQKIFAHHKGRMDRILFSLSKGEKTAFEIAMYLFPGVPPFEVFLGISEAVGHLEILREKGIVDVKEKGAIDYYSLET
ncbi:MAG TPA: MBL fold metallo-hydrolase [Thermodesulfobacteriota bacterium]|jgi:glyoxylase-like metal-dependent hydrolase (beta-lactamase superfamily II)|nr:MBL fold metallo-hydrolase [Thermodesulfobacteriota bacterium]